MRKLKLTWYFHVLVFSSTLSHFLKSQWPDQLIILSSGIHRGSSRESASVISKNLKDMFLGRGQLKFPVSLAFARNCTKIRREVSSALLCWLDVLVVFVPSWKSLINTSRILMHYIQFSLWKCSVHERGEGAIRIPVPEILELSNFASLAFPLLCSLAPPFRIFLFLKQIPDIMSFYSCALQHTSQ